MAKTNQIGLDQAKAKQLAEKMNVLLASYQLFYINSRGFHWNISGDKFFELHVKFEEIYTDAQIKIDEIAERILTLGHTPLHSFTDYLKTSMIKEVTNVSDGKAAVKHIVEGFQQLIGTERDLLELAGEAHDEGTNSQMSDYIRQQEKAVWMYNSFLKAR
jgi:starvation-inducible DNA-binding protein